jgi:tetratricopeptide (TPR) repeat protein
MRRGLVRARRREMAAGESAMLGIISAWRGWRERAEVMRDVRRRAADQKEFNKFKVRDLLLEAQAAADVSDMRKANALWEEAVALDREATAASASVSKLLIALKRLDEGEAMLTEGARSHPGDSHYLTGLAAIAMANGEEGLAVERYAALRKRFPGEASGYVLAADALIRLGRLEEADAISAEAMRRFPEDIRGYLGRARILVRREAWEDALSQWRRVAEKFPTFSFGVVGMAGVYIKTGRFDEADAVIEEARVRHGMDSGLFATLAESAQARGDREEAIRRWTRRVERFPMEWWGYRQAAEALQALGAFAEAEAMLRAAVDRFEENLAQLRDLAAFLRKRGDLAGEAAVWETIRTRFPSQEEGYLMSAATLRRLGRAAEAEAAMAAHKERFAVAA